MNTDCVFIVHNCLTHDDLRCLWSECTSTNGGFDLSELGASIDLFEHSVISEESSIRVSETDFFDERWKDFDTSPEFESIMKDILLRKLPYVVSRLYSVDSSLYLFNEHYVVKNVNSDLEFRWHTDANEQLPSIPVPSRPEYVSVWCPLQDVSPLNGSIAFPRGSTILCCGTFISP